MKFVYVHLPKTGGTAIDNILRYDNKVWHKSDIKCKNPEKYDILMGHFHRDWYEGSKITFLRQPIERVISHYSAWKRRFYHGKTTVIGKPSTQMTFKHDIGICEFAEKLGNLYYEYGVNVNKFDYIGFTNTIDTDLTRLSEVYNFRLPDVLPVINTQHHYKITIKEYFDLKDILKKDRQIYREARDVFGEN
ncbi:MAG: sulfotransferase family 2 domain-containing protein [Candidatus Cloacimonetes bacterium]|nr:sulfotransferase family 2 domain-containing protein [Candidatus Cloacimonadota bacterium]